MFPEQLSDMATDGAGEQLASDDAQMMSPHFVTPQQRFVVGAHDATCTIYYCVHLLQEATEELRSNHVNPSVVVQNLPLLISYMTDEDSFIVDSTTKMIEELSMNETGILAIRQCAPMVAAIIDTLAGSMHSGCTNQPVAVQVSDRSQRTRQSIVRASCTHCRSMKMVKRAS
jgi:hypothetical protein